MPLQGATAAEIAAIRRRYLWMATSIFIVDLGIQVIFRAVNGRWIDLWIPETPAVLLFLVANWLIARRLFEPIRRFLAGEVSFEAAERRLTQLPLLTARWVGLFSLIVNAYRNSLVWWLLPVPEEGLPPGVGLGLLPPTIADFITAAGKGR